MECSICFGDISVATGRTILSCSHEFHLSCIVNWLHTGSECCPLCRTETGAMEKIKCDDENSSVSSDEVGDLLEADHGLTALMSAARDNEVDEIRHLVTVEGVDIDAKDSDGDSALSYAMINQKEEAAIELLRLGANPLTISRLAPCYSGEESPCFALHAACKFAFVPCVSRLLDSGLDPNCVLPNGRPPLLTTLESKNAPFETIQLLIARGAIYLRPTSVLNTSV